MSRQGQLLDVLIAEDNDVIRKCMEKSLCSMGYSVFAVKDGAELVEYMNLHYSLEQEQTLPIVLTDYNMPIMNGLQAACTVRRMYRNLKIIMITSEEEIVNESYESRIVDVVIPKPISRNALEDIIQQCKGEDRLLNETCK